MQCNKVTLASPIQNLWFILFDRSSGRQSPLTVEPSRNSEDDNYLKMLLFTFIWLAFIILPHCLYSGFSTHNFDFKSAIKVILVIYAHFHTDAVN